MKTDVQIYPLTGNAKVIKDYARAISELSASASNAYVMAFDSNNEVVWCIQAESDTEDLKEMSMKEVKRVEIYDHGFVSDGDMYKMEQIYVNSQKYLDEYFEKANEFGTSYEISENRTNLKAA